MHDQQSLYIQYGEGCDYAHAENNLLMQLIKMELLLLLTILVKSLITEKAFIDPGVKMGEGWLLTGEVVSLD